METNEGMPEITANPDQPETGQTGQELSNRRPYFEVAPDDEDRWHWILWSGNGRPMATNVIPYKKQNDCTAAVETLQKLAISQSTKIVIARG